MTNDIVGHIVNYCIKNGIEITDTDDREDSFVFFSEKLIMIYHPDKNVLALSFHVITPPDQAAQICMKMRNIEGVNVAISDVYVLCDQGVMTGQEAIMYMESTRKDEAIKQFIQEQQKLQVLCFTEGFDC